MLIVTNSIMEDFLYYAVIIFEFEYFLIDNW